MDCCHSLILPVPTHSLAKVKYESFLDQAGRSYAINAAERRPIRWGLDAGTYGPSSGALRQDDSRWGTGQANWLRREGNPVTPRSDFCMPRQLQIQFPKSAVQP